MTTARVPTTMAAYVYRVVGPQEAGASLEVPGRESDSCRRVVEQTQQPEENKSQPGTAQVSQSGGRDSVHVSPNFRLGCVVVVQVGLKLVAGAPVLVRS